MSQNINFSLKELSFPFLSVIPIFSCQVRIASGGLSGWGEAGQYGPPEPVASAIKVLPYYLEQGGDISGRYRFFC